jgi:hypothetical protein
MYDVIIIGGGIAGLYATYAIQKHKKKKCLLIEKEETCGGRIKYDLCWNEMLKMGGGLLRRKDKHTIALLDKFSIPYAFSTHYIQYASSIKPENVMLLLDQLRSEFKKSPPVHDRTFKSYAEKVWGRDTYINFKKSCFYTDIDDSDVEDILKTWDMSFYVSGFKEGSVEWYKLVQAFVQKISPHISTNTTVTKLTETKDGWTVDTTRGVYQSTYVIMATCISPLITLLPQFPIYKQIHENASIKIYAKLDPSCYDIMNKAVPMHTIVPNELHNVMPIHPAYGIYLIAYADDGQSEQLKSYTDDTEVNRTYLSRKLEEGLGLQPSSISLLSIHAKHWPCAIHTYDASIPFNGMDEFQHKAKCPHPKLRVIGEVVSNDQGWVGSAINTVYELMAENWFKSV